MALGLALKCAAEQQTMFSFLASTRVYATLHLFHSLPLKIENVLTGAWMYNNPESGAFVSGRVKGMEEHLEGCQAFFPKQHRTSFVFSLHNHNSPHAKDGMGHPLLVLLSCVCVNIFTYLSSHKYRILSSNVRTTVI